MRIKYLFIIALALLLVGQNSLVFAQDVGTRIQQRQELLQKRQQEKQAFAEKLQEFGAKPESEKTLIYLQGIVNYLQERINAIVNLVNVRGTTGGTGPLPRIPIELPAPTVTPETAAVPTTPPAPEPVTPSLVAASLRIPSVQFVVATTSNPNILTASPAPNTPSSTLQELAEVIQSLPVPENPDPAVSLTANATSAPVVAPPPAQIPGLLDQVINFLNPFEPAFPTVVGPTPSVQSPQLVNAPIVWTAQGTGGSGNYEYQFVVRAAGSTQWLVAKPYSSSNSYLWTPSEPGIYSIGVNIRNQGSSRDTEDFKETTYTITAPPVSASLSLSQNSITRGQSATLSWLSSNSNWCDITDDASSPDIGRVAISGSRTVSPTETITYNLTCTGDGGVTQDREILTVTAPAPSVSFSASPASITRGNSATLTWSSTNASICSLQINNDLSNVAISGSKSVSPQTNTTYKIICGGAGGGAEAQTTVAVNNPPPAPTASLSTNQTSIIRGNSAILSWTSANATSCSIDNGVGSVATAGSKTISPTTNTTYTLSCTGPGGPIQSQTTINVVLPAPEATFSANPSIVLSGTPITLAWSSSNADNCSINQNIGSVATSGSKVVTPPVGTITYTLSCSGPGGNIPKQATVNVGSSDLPSAALTVASPVALPGVLDRFINLVTFGTRFAKLGNITVNPSSPQLTGTTIQLNTSAAEGSGNYEYAFWLVNRESGSQWGLLRGYSDSAQFVWAPSQAGNYVLGVAIRNQGSSREAEDFKEVEFTVNRRPDPVTIQTFTGQSAG